MCGLGHILEAQGLATTLVGLVPQHVRRMRPPRALLVPFELGRPLGAPGDARLQRRVLSAALALLDRAGPGSVVERLEVDLAPAADMAEPWVCPVAFPAPAAGDSRTDRLLSEISLLEPWFDRGRRDRGSTAVLSEVPMAELARWLCQFLEDPAPTGPPSLDEDIGAAFKLSVEDLKAYYLEAVTAQPGAGSAAEINGWFWNETEAGALLRDLRLRLREHPDQILRLHAAFTLVPEAELDRDRRSA